MAFKLNPPFKIDGSPVYERELEEGVLGKGNKNGTILVARNLNDKAEKSRSEENTSKPKSPM